MNEQEQPRNENGIAGKPLTPQVDANGTVFESLQAANTPLPKPSSAEGTKEATSALHKESELPHLRTYESDIADVIKHDKASLINVAVASQEKKQELHRATIMNVADPEAEQPRNYKPLILVVVILLIVGGLGLLGGLYVFIIRPQTNVVPQTPAMPDGTNIVSSESSKKIVITNGQHLQEAFAAELKASTQQKGKMVRLEAVTPTFATSSEEASISLDPETFGSRLETGMEPWLIRSFTDYAFGYYQDETAQPFIIFKSNSFENAFAGMIRWEPTMQSDLVAIIPEAAAPASASSSTTPAVSEELVWSDMIIKNKDVRVLKYPSSAKGILYYSLYDKETIILTTHEEALKELFVRLINTKFSR